jgi:histidyl-tRNA synthetase
VVAILGPDEVAAGQVKLRDMGTKEEATVTLEEAASAVSAMLAR